MGMYTMMEGVFRLKESTPAEVWNALEWIASDDGEAPEKFKSLHPLFECWRARRMFYSTGETHCFYYTPRANVARRELTVDVGFELKNYEKEIQKFLDFLSPYCERVADGWYMYEENQARSQILLNEGALTIVSAPVYERPDPLESWFGGN